jgi:ABC-type multidrug transport system fused ATPase/permease subunit
MKAILPKISPERFLALSLIVLFMVSVAVVVSWSFTAAKQAKRQYRQQYEAEAQKRDAIQMRIDSLKAAYAQIESAQERLYEKYQKLEQENLILRTEYEKISRKYRLPSLEQLRLSTNGGTTTGN